MCYLSFLLIFVVISDNKNTHCLLFCPLSPSDVYYLLEDFYSSCQNILNKLIEALFLLSRSLLSFYFYLRIIVCIGISHYPVQQIDLKNKSLDTVYFAIKLQEMDNMDEHNTSAATIWDSQAHIIMLIPACLLDIIPSIYILSKIWYPLTHTYTINFKSK